MLRRLLLLVLLALAAPALAQPRTVMSPDSPVRVTLTTSAGAIVVEVDPVRAPVTAANFLRYVDARRLDGTEFYRAMKTGEGAGLVQGGVRDPTKLFPPIAHEPTSRTGLSHVDGALSVPRFAPGTGTRSDSRRRRDSPGAPSGCLAMAPSDARSRAGHRPAVCTS